MSHCAGVGESGDTTEAAEQSVNKIIPAAPVLQPNGAATSVECVMSNIAIALNGVGIFSGAVDQNCNQLDVTDSEAEWISFDCCAAAARNVPSRRRRQRKGRGGAAAATWLFRGDERRGDAAAAR